MKTTEAKILKKSKLVQDAFIQKSKNILNKKWYSEEELKTILRNRWRKYKLDYKEAIAYEFFVLYKELFGEEE